MTFQANIDAHDRLQRTWRSGLAAAVQKVMRVKSAARRLRLVMPLVVLAACGGGGGGGGGGSTGGGAGGGGAGGGSATTYSVSGTITPTGLGAGAQIALTGATTGNATADASGGFDFSGLANGTYTLTPTKTSVTFSPASREVTVSGGNVLGVAFTATSAGGGGPPTPTTYAISGTITPLSLGANVTVTLTGAFTTAATTDASGNYSFTGLANGAYAVTPSGTSLSFAPPNASVTINGASQTGVNFVASAVSGGGGGGGAPPPTAAISGTISPLPLGAGVSVALGGAATATAITDSAGKFSFASLANGTYTLTPSKTSISFSPTSQQVTLTGTNVTNTNFTASSSGGGPPTPTTWSISGTVTPQSIGAGVQVALSGAATATTTADASGAYSFSGLANGSYTVTPSGTSLSFTPTNRQVSINGANVAGMNFAGSSTPNVVFFDDFNGSTLGSAWTALDRSGPASQAENLCNKPSAVTVSGGNLVITTTATPSTCGDAVSSPSQQPYTSGSIQWTNLNFTYGVVEIRAKFPPQNTKTWPALWLLGSNCQAANIVNGSEAVPFMGCPAQGQAAYREIDMVECDTRSWCHIVVAQGTGGWSEMCVFPVDANWHVFTLNWTSSAVSIAVDGAPTGCSYSNTSLKGPAFLIIQTQTTNASGVGGMPNNANLPTTLQVDYVKVTQP